MMKAYAIRFGCAAWVILSLTACITPVKTTMPPEARTIAGGRDLMVSVPQGELDAEINPANGGAAFGLVGGLIDVAVNQSRAKDAQNAVKPVRDALTDYQFDQQALAAARDGLKTISWMGVEKTSFSKELSNDRIMATLDSASTSQVIFISFNYALAWDFESLATSWTVTIAPKKTASGQQTADRINNDNLIYNQRFVCVLPLASPAKDVPGNAQIWAADKARLARFAIQSCFNQIAPLVQKSAEMSKESRDALKNGEKFSNQIAHVNGKLIQKDAQGNLVLDFLDRWVLVLNPSGGS